MPDIKIVICELKATMMSVELRELQHAGSAGSQRDMALVASIFASPAAIPGEAGVTGPFAGRAAHARLWVARVPQCARAAARKWRQEEVPPARQRPPLCGAARHGRGDAVGGKEGRGGGGGWRGRVWGAGASSRRGRGPGLLCRERRGCGAHSAQEGTAAGLAPGRSVRAAGRRRRPCAQRRNHWHRRDPRGSQDQPPQAGQSRWGRAGCLGYGPGPAGLEPRLERGVEGGIWRVVRAPAFGLPGPAPPWGGSRRPGRLPGKGPVGRAADRESPRPLPARRGCLGWADFSGPVGRYRAAPVRGVRVLPVEGSSPAG